MRLSDYILLALRNIGRQKLRSALTIFAVVIGGTSVTIMLALVFGARGFFVSQLEATGMFQQVAVSPHADIGDFNDAQGSGSYNCDGCVRLTDGLVDKIKALPHVSGVARMTRNAPFQAITLDGKKLTLNGMSAYDANGIIASTMLAGRDLRPSDTEGVITITSDYADKFGYKQKYQNIIGKKVQLQSQGWYTGVGANVQPPKQCNGPCDNNTTQHPPTILAATIVGVMDTSNQSGLVRVPLPWMRGMQQNRQYQFTKADQAAQEAYCRTHMTRNGCNAPQHMTLLTTNYLDQNGYDALTVKADKSSNASAVARDIRKLGVGAADAETMIKSQLAIFNIVGAILGGIGGIALAVAAVGVVNTMIMAILERTREIGVMRAVGARRATVRLLFTIEAAMLGFWGGVLGVAAGYGLTRVANIFINQQLASSNLKAHDIIGLPLWLIFAVIGITTIIGMLAGLYPAARAAKLDPVEALRYE